MNPLILIGNLLLISLQLKSFSLVARIPLANIGQLSVVISPVFDRTGHANNGLNQPNDRSYHCGSEITFQGVRRRGTRAIAALKILGDHEIVVGWV